MRFSSVSYWWPTLSIATAAEGWRNPIRHSWLKKEDTYSWGGNLWWDQGSERSSENVGHFCVWNYVCLSDVLSKETDLSLSLRPIAVFKFILIHVFCSCRCTHTLPLPLSLTVARWETSVHWVRHLGAHVHVCTPRLCRCWRNRLFLVLANVSELKASQKKKGAGGAAAWKGSAVCSLSFFLRLPPLRELQAIKDRKRV